MSTSNGSAEFFAAWEGKQKQIMTETPQVAKGFGGMFQALMQDGALSVREKELIALGIGLSERCMPCVNLHVQKSLGAGATREQILEAVGVAVMMNGGPVFTHVPEVIAALDHLEEKS